jgi:predicted amidophosphoribosyltransferase
MEFQRDGYCGLYCGACPNLLATENGTVEELAKARNMPAEDTVCSGCKSDRVSPWCTTCDIKLCAREKGYEFCGECSEAPCNLLTQFIEDKEYPYHLGVMKNLHAIREDSVTAWLEAQDPRWRCTSCNSKFAWQDETCSACGNPVSNYKADI